MNDYTPAPRSAKDYRYKALQAQLVSKPKRNHDSLLLRTAITLGITTLALLSFTAGYLLGSN